MSQIDPRTLRSARELRGLSGRRLGGNLAQRLQAPDRERALTVALARMENGESAALGADDRAALAAELGRSEADLYASPHFSFDFGGLVTVGLSLATFSAVEAAQHARGVLHGFAHRPGREPSPSALIGRLAGAEVVPLFRSGVERWIAQEYGDGLNEHERAYVVAVDPDERELLARYLIERIVGPYELQTPEARRMMVDGFKDLGEQGIVGRLDFDALHEMARRRLDRLDVPVPTYDRWRAEAENLAAAAAAQLADAA